MTKENGSDGFLRYKYLHIRYWDAAMIAAALELGCHTLYTEDLNHGQDYGGVRVANPFRGKDEG